ncbi:hypothetical protein LOTGIDRAFT_174674 [Lottia gigantea]|uniref:MATH domain-containing protein n=1 Tax=Lottia gigantea TaxID=225164 RepID=V4AJ11_LOTGI|nr:hypothetical protein LOTGIDRAFT_174674 [Lottia gigantea]ESO97042.1 hypothetical protein LOTGIDRAFT_174674 [Lottia gigantea]
MVQFGNVKITVIYISKTIMEDDSPNFGTESTYREISTNGNAFVGTDINSLVLQTIIGESFENSARNKQPEECISNDSNRNTVGVYNDERDANVPSRTVNSHSMESTEMDSKGVEKGHDETSSNNCATESNVLNPDTSSTTSVDENATNVTRRSQSCEHNKVLQNNRPIDTVVDDVTQKITAEIPFESAEKTESIEPTEKVESKCGKTAKDSTEDNLNSDRKEILKLKKDLESVRAELLQELSSVDDERLVMQESILMVQNKIYQQRRVLLKCLNDLTSGKYQQTNKHSEHQEGEINQTFGILEDRKADLENLMGKLPRMAEKSHNYNVPDIIEAGQKILDECKRKLTPLKLSYLEFNEGEVNFEGLSSMMGSLKTVGYSSEDQNAISARLINGVVPGLHSRARVREVSVESTCTQISSGDLSDQFTVSTQTDFDGDKGCVGPAEGKLILRVNVEDIESNIDRCCESTPLDLLGLSWRVMANKHWRDQLQIRLYYKNIEHIEKCVEYVEYGYTFKLVNHINDTWSIVKKESHKIGRDSWWDSVIGWGRLEDPKCGYVLNKWFTIESTVSVIDVKFF